MIKLYHYSKEKFNILKTLEKQGKVTKEDIKKATTQTIGTIRPGYYYQHISFFLIPVDVVKIGKIYGNDHLVWHPGSKLTEHTVLLDDLGEFKYEFVETPEKTKLYYDDSISIQEYHRLVNKLNVSKKYIGNSKDDFTEAFDSLITQIKPAYDIVKSRPNWDLIKEKYAATIPHVMIYPKSGTVEVSKSKQISIL